MTVFPYKTIGIIGGGQLGRMMALSAKAMGYYVAVLDPTPNCPCGQVADIEITAEYNDMEAIKKLAQISDVITYEFENIDYDALVYLEKNAYLPQGKEALRITRHRFTEKSVIRDMGVPVPEFFLIENPNDLEKKFFFPSALKTTTGGYDGKGQVFIRSEADKELAVELVKSRQCILEKFVPFDMEVSVVAARSTAGEVKTFPVVENIHVNKILHMSIAPARISDKISKKATEYAEKILSELNGVGVFGIEMYVVGEEILINELAPRPHNSGHYTIDACITSQFEQHVRAICGLPLGDPSLHSHVVMINILGNHMDSEKMDNLGVYLPLLEKGKLHLYGKTEAKAKANSKMGHINILGDIDETLAAVKGAGIWKN